jgi:hypothetical protein
MPRGVLAYINFVDPRTGADPGFGIEAGGGHPDQGLPGHGHPDQGLPNAPVRPDNGLPPLNVARPWPPRPHPWPPQKPDGPSITDPDWGIDAGLAPEQPIYIPADPPPAPGQGLPPYAGNLPVEPVEPGTIWPPVDGLDPAAEGFLLVLVLGVGFRYVKVIGAPPATEPDPGVPTHPIVPPAGTKPITPPPAQPKV